MEPRRSSPEAGVFAFFFRKCDAGVAGGGMLPAWDAKIRCVSIVGFVTNFAGSSYW